MTSQGVSDIALKLIASYLNTDTSPIKSPSSSHGTGKHKHLTQVRWRFDPPPPLTELINLQEVAFVVRLSWTLLLVSCWEFTWWVGYVKGDLRFRTWIVLKRNEFHCLHATTAKEVQRSCIVSLSLCTRHCMYFSHPPPPLLVIYHLSYDDDRVGRILLDLTLRRELHDVHLWEERGESHVF